MKLTTSYAVCQLQGNSEPNKTAMQIAIIATINPSFILSPYTFQFFS